MKYIYTFLFIGFMSGLLVTQSTAQEEWIGCHSLSGKKLTPLTPAQRQAIQAGIERSDTFDIVHYLINLDVTDFAGKRLTGNCEVSFSPKMDSISYLNLDLLNYQIDSVITKMGESLAYEYDSLLLTIYFDSILSQQDTHKVDIYYQGNPTLDPDWGGFYFENGYAYNLGIGLTSSPPNFGRSWFPCFDNFVERSTYEYRVMSSKGRRAFCVGSFISEDSLGGDSVLRTYRMDQQIPTYLSNVSVSTYSAVDHIHDGAFGPVPIQFVAKTSDTTRMKNSLQFMPEAVDALEFWFGPYPWERVGYVATTVGAMEHPTSVAYPEAILDGDPTSNNRLMAHELGHHWWGNVTTLKEPHDMWIKEGPAEYSAHLFREWVFGKDDFKKTVMDNLEYVLENAHLHDGGYQALSPMPFPYIYGTHTYRKGALVFHNLRAYLGDSLFSSAMKSILQTYPYQAIDATQMRDQLSLSSGINLDAFFRNWIFNPGYASFYIENITDVSNTPDAYDFEITFYQGLHKAPEMFEDVPLEISFYDENWNREVREVTASGLLSTVQVNDLPFSPAMIALNEDNRINLATLHGNRILRETDFHAIPYSDFIFNVHEITDSTLARVEHYWAGPSADMAEPEIGQLSSTHFWRVNWLAAGEFSSGARIEYNGGGPEEFDYEISGQSEDSLILAYRPHPQTPWFEHPSYRKFTLNPTDGRGFILIDDLQPGDYAFAKISPTTSTDPLLSRENPIAVYPNPAVQTVQVEGQLPASNTGEVVISLYSSEGKALRQESVLLTTPNLAYTLELPDGHQGILIMEIRDKNNRLLHSEVLEQLPR